MKKPTVKFKVLYRSNLNAIEHKGSDYLNNLLKVFCNEPANARCKKN